MTLLEVDGLSVHFSRRKSFLSGAAAVVRAVDGVSFQINEGQTFGILGASGCGKSTIAQALLGLVPVTAGAIRLHGRPLDMARDHRAIQIVFQDPQTSFNPRRRIWELITEPLVIAGERDRRALKRKAEELAAKVGVGEHQLERFPHEFSGGQRQRLAIARALAIGPRLLVLDEPTSALDVSVQAQVLNLLLQLQREFKVAFLFISHDVAVIRHICDELAVMKSGKFVETGRAVDVLASPRHPYTQALMNAAPTLTGPAFREQCEEPMI